MEEKPTPFTKTVKSATPGNSTHPQNLAHPPALHSKTWSGRQRMQPICRNETLNEWEMSVQDVQESRELVYFRVDQNSANQRDWEIAK
jgi:hypothetical protein